MLNMPSLEDIEKQLKLLEKQYALLPGQSEEIISQLKQLEQDDPVKFKDYSDSISKGLPGLTKGVIAGVKAGKSGDPLAISIAALDVFSSVVTMSGPLLGPVGPLVSALSGMISMILGELLPKGPSLKQEITELLDKFLAEALLRDLGTAADQIWVFTDTVEHHSTAWKPLNLQHGPEIKAVDDAWQWLMSPEKQSLPQWGEVLEKTCHVFNQLLRSVALSIANPSTRPGVEPGAMLVYLPARLESTLGRLQEILPVARKRGTFWHIGPNDLYSYLELGKVYTTQSVVKKEVEWRNLGSQSRLLSVSLNQGQEARLNPIVTVLALEPADGGSLPSGRDGSAYENIVLYDKDHPFRAGARAYSATGKWPADSGWNQLNSDNASYPLDGCYDIHAIPAAKQLSGGVYFYTANGKDCRGYEIADDGKVHCVWSLPAGDDRTIGAIRCVREPRIFPDDPDADPNRDQTASNESYSVLYGGCQQGPHSNLVMQVLIRYWGIEGDETVRYIRTPFSSFRGISVDQGYLWVYTASQIACATHVSIRNALLKNRPPSWMSCTTLPAGVQFMNDDKLISGLLDVSACDDGTLFATFLNGCWRTQGINKAKLFMLTPQIDRAKKALAIEPTDYDEIRGSGFRVHKQPLFCWNMLEQLTATLKQKVKPHSVAEAAG